ncbi:hypothetical protein [Methyloversatilis sp.]|uniref:hypothetical protein n=1 Tax=Methyloversatilis sp. TaxID=2569862 RepID=UPI002736BBE6|nr:hypothetical protein [Methyloversatilis sp.]MDP3579142.1 hypothetical protein [Methyloversatilis sp.]
MVAPIDICSDKALTGRARVRMGFRRRLVLQVEVTVVVYRYFKQVGERTRWRDARPEDAIGRTLTLVPYE